MSVSINWEKKLDALKAVGNRARATCMVGTRINKVCKMKFQLGRKKGLYGGRIVHTYVDSEGHVYLEVIRWE